MGIKEVYEGKHRRGGSTGGSPSGGGGGNGMGPSFAMMIVLGIICLLIVMVAGAH